MAMRNLLDGLALESTLAAIRARVEAVLQTNVTDRADRLLGLAAVTNFPAVQAADVVDRVARVLGVADISDRAARVLGQVSVTNLPSTQAVDVIDRAARVLGIVTGPLTDAQLRAAAVPVSGPLTDAQLRASVVHVRERRSANATEPRVQALAATEVTLLVPSNPARLSVTIQNNSTADVYVGYATGAKLNAKVGIRIPAHGGTLNDQRYTGPIYGWSATASEVVTVEVSE